MKLNFLKITAAVLAVFSIGFFSSCEDDGDGDGTNDTVTVIIPDTNIVRLTENISADATWKTGKTYILGGRITVLSGATLRIQPGVVVKGEAGTGANSTALLVARGAKIMAEGTADLPIIFTTIADEITPADVAAGNVASPNMDPDITGFWGGVIILGKAPISASNDNDEDVSEVQIEGIPTSDQNGLYGGNVADDNSGVFKYVSIRHGGTNIGAGNEINGLSLGGVGSGTLIENVEIVGNADDGIEYFGGTVNSKNVVVWNVKDDAIDTDQSWAGTLDNFFIVTPFDGGHAFELDGPEGSMEAGHIIMNGTIIASSEEVDEDGVPVKAAADLINVDANSIVTLKNLFFTNVVDGQKINRVTAEDVVFENIVLDVPADSLAKHVNGTVPAGVTAGTATGAAKAALSWTWAAEAGKLD